MQDPPNGALECKVDGVATTTAVTITAPAVMTDESGVMTLTYDAELVSMMRGGPTIANMIASAEVVSEEEVVLCDEGSGVSLFIDDLSTTDCPSPMSSTTGFCFSGNNGGDDTCASGFILEPICGGPPYFCVKQE